MSIPDLSLDKLFDELDYPERVEFLGPRARLAKRRLSLSALLLTTSIGAIICHNTLLALAAAGLLIAYVAVVSSTEHPSKTIFALTTTRVLEISADQVSVYATRKDIKSVHGHKIQFNNCLPPLSLLVDPRGGPSAMLVHEKPPTMGEGMEGFKP